MTCPRKTERRRQQKREILRGVTKHEAESFLAKRIESVARGEYTADADMTMSDLFEKFMRHKAKRLEATTLDRYEGIIATYLRPTFGKMRLTALRKAHLIEAYEKWQAQKQTRRSGRTIRHVHDLLRATLNWAVSLDYAPNQRRRQDHVRRPSQGLQTREHGAQRERATPLAGRGAIAHLPGKKARHRLVATVVLSGVGLCGLHGARRGEVLATRWTDLDLDGGTVTIRESLAQPRSGLAFKRPKNGQVRTVTITSELVAVLRSHKARQAAEQVHLGEEIPPARPGLRDAQRHAGSPRPSGRHSSGSSSGQRSRGFGYTTCETPTPRSWQKLACRSRWSVSDSVIAASASPSIVT